MLTSPVAAGAGLCSRPAPPPPLSSNCEWSEGLETGSVMLDVDLGMLELDAPCSFVVTTAAADCASLPASSGAVSVFPLPVKSEPNASAQQC